MAARFQVIEVKHGYAVKDTKDDKIVTKTYKTAGWAARRAIRLSDEHQNLKYV